MKLHDEAQGVKRVDLITPYPLGEKLRQRLIKKVQVWLKADRVIAQEISDPSLLGGFMMVSDDHVYDASVKRMLANLKHQLTQIV